ncbi:MULTISPECIES: ABC transporter ATP-binding protein [Paraburkholderia]|uniref:ABC transporter ATP-binding protein n=1 Tax=Paraburkholderia TaxID=1822464 RepID=UPI002257D02E|nr:MULTISPECIES: ABC transporter ATP-binding protein [Paraburkholderia]MCX4174531.1 ABC transporter ATP-binding protein [Paraburkholderia madseniana]MDQ6462532.1 ABC transporter ATP-binding protein [Paraburkholderia madseniana]
MTSSSPHDAVPKQSDVPALSTTSLTIRFGGHVAVNSVTTQFSPGTLTAIVGPNGAGKTTFFNLLSGQLKSTSGQIHFKGEDITRLNVAKRTRMGIGRAFQLTNLFPQLSVIENVRLAVQSRHRAGFNVTSMWKNRADLIEQANHYVAQVGLAPRSNELAAQLSHGGKRRLEVAILMALEPEIFMFDEPTAGMSADEVPLILDQIKRLKQQGDKTILLVEHKLNIVHSLADRIIVLHNGELLADGPPAVVMRSQIVQEAYLGAKRPVAKRGTQEGQSYA